MKLSYEFYESNNSADKTLSPIVLHHGLFESNSTWRAIAQPLTQNTRREVYAINMRNHGKSSRSDEFNFEILQDDLLEFLDDHKLRKVILIGHSLGGKVVISFALKYPKRVEKLVVEDVPVQKFINPVGNLVLLLGTNISPVLDILKQLGDQAESERYLRELGHIFAEKLRVSDEIVDSYDINLLPLFWNGQYYDVDLNVQVIVNALVLDKLQQDDDMSGRYEEETLFLCGSRSQFKSQKDQSIEKYFPRAVKVIFEDAGHFIHHTFPQKFLDEVIQFINNQSTQLKSKY